jgi:divalent metal cation (Fe/Co/Zn/Cd) transporter
MVMHEITSTIGILSSMITPAVLILASGSLIMTTSQRLARTIERVRKISQEFMMIERSADQESPVENKRRILYTLLKQTARRSKLLTRAMILLYLSLGMFVATSLAIGVVSVTGMAYTWVPTAFGVIGSVFLFASSFILIIESRLTFLTIADEVDYVIESSKTNAPQIGRVPPRQAWRKWFRL